MPSDITSNLVLYRGCPPGVSWRGSQEAFCPPKLSTEGCCLPVQHSLQKINSRRTYVQSNHHHDTFRIVSLCLEDASKESPIEGAVHTMTTHSSPLPPPADCFGKLQPSWTFLFILPGCLLTPPAWHADETLTGGVLCVVDGHFWDSRTCFFSRRDFEICLKSMIYDIYSKMQGVSYLSSREWNGFGWD